MRLTDDFHEQKPVNMTLINMTLLMSVIVISILGLVFWVNMPAKAARKIGDTQTVSNVSKMEKEAEDMKASVDELISGSTLTSNDLDIWSLPDYEEGLSKDADNGSMVSSGDGIVSSKSDYLSGTVDLSASAAPEQTTTASDTVITPEGVAAGASPATDIQEIVVGAEKKEEVEAVIEEEEKDPSEDGNHIKITYANGKEEWIELNPKLTTNDYDFTKLMYEKPIMNYYQNGKRVSYFGMDISKSQGVVDFNKFRKAGGEFVMLKLGGRGYSSGQMVVDEMFPEYAKSALDADLHVGVYFFSQAATKAEAEEEAKLVIENLKGYTIKYPVVFRMETIGGDMTRIDDLTIKERTEVAKAFLDKIKSAGFIPMLYGDKEWLLTKYDLEQLQQYEIWYAEAEDIPDYPYKMGMWQYKKDGAIDGVAGDIKLDISFKNYANM